MHIISTFFVHLIDLYFIFIIERRIVKFKCIQTKEKTTYILVR